MRKLILLAMLSSLSAMAQEPAKPVAEEVAQVEVTGTKKVEESSIPAGAKMEVYLDIANNDRVIGEWGFGLTVPLADICKNRQDTAVLKYACSDANKKKGGYVRMAVMDFAMGTAIPNNKISDEAFIKGSHITVLEAQTGHGTFFNILRIGIGVDYKSKFVDVVIPLATAKVGQNVDIDITKSGVVKIYLTGAVEGGLQVVGYDDLLSKDYTDRNFKFVHFINVYGEGGLKIANILKLGANTKLEWDKFSTTQEKGVVAEVNLWPKTALTLKGSMIDRETANTVLNNACVGTTSEKFWFVGAGFKVEF